MFLRLSTAKLLDEYMAENAGNSISEVQILKFSRGSIVTGHSYTVPPPFSSTLLYPCICFRFWCSYTFFVSKPARFSGEH